MSTRELKRSFASTPVVKLSPYEVDGVRYEVKTGSRFVGFIKSKNETKYGDAVLFSVVEGDAPTKIKTDDGRFIDVDVKVGQDVTIFAGGQLKEKLGLSKPGEKIEIVYNGKKLNPKSGRRFNDFTVSVIE